MNELTQSQVNKKYKDKYISFIKTWKDNQWMYEVYKTHKTIHENSTLGQDVGTDMEYSR